MKKTIDLLNEKTILKLQRKMLKKYEITPNGKIRIHFFDERKENYSSQYEVIMCLNARFNLGLISKSQPTNINQDEHIEENQIFRQYRDRKDSVIRRLKSLLNDLNASSYSEFHDNIIQIKKTISLMKEDLALFIASDLLIQFDEIYYKDSNSTNKTMLIYADTIREELKRQQEILCNTINSRKVT